MKAKDCPPSAGLDAMSRHSRARVKPSKLNECAGQAVIEYVLVVCLAVLIFGAMFAAMRRSMYNIWVCQIGPRVQAPTGCAGDVHNCWDAIRRADSTAEGKADHCE